MGAAPDLAVIQLASAAGMSATEARALTDRLRQSAEHTWDLVVEAYTGRAWAALGYGSWDAYCSAEFGSLRLRLPPEERAGITASLRDAGLSVRAIAAATGTSKSTVSRALSGVPNGTPEATVTGTDGKTYAATRPVQDDPPRWNGRIHPFLEAIPLMAEQVLPALTESIRCHGLLEPGWLDPDGTMLDGRLRRMACEALGIPMLWRTFHGEDELALIYAANVQRQHFTPDQMAFVELGVSDRRGAVAPSGP